MTLTEFKALDNDGRKNILLQILGELQSFNAVEIGWEKDIEASNASGETVGRWMIYIYKHDHSAVIKEATTLEAALIPAAHEADEANAEYWKERDAARTAALSKLNAEDRKALGL